MFLKIIFIFLVLTLEGEIRGEIVAPYCKMYFYTANLYTSYSCGLYISLFLKLLEIMIPNLAFYSQNGVDRRFV